MCSEPDADSHRFMDLLDAAIEAGEAQRYPKFAAWAKKVAARPRPKPGSGGKRKKQHATGRGHAGAAAAGSEAALIAAIRGRQAAPFGGVLGQLMASMPDEPSEEEFAAAAARLKQRGGGGGGKPKAAAGGSKRAKK